MTKRFAQVAVIGVGLVGGSLARVLKENGLAGEIVGAGRSAASLERARALGVIDRAAPSAAEAAAGADLVVLAAPVGAFERIVRECAPRLKKGAIVTDVGSVKGGLVSVLERLMPAGVAYVPSHPIAGKETSGVDGSSASLFRGAKCILTPTGSTDRGALERISAVWEAAGATVVVMDAHAHDHVFAAVSHLPHVAAYAMMYAVADLTEKGEHYINYTGGGFRDFTRIAASSPELWRDICLLNSSNIIEMIERYQYALNKLKRALRRSDGEKLERIFRAASEVRKGMR